MNNYLNVLKKYAAFKGRARRKDYWTFILFNLFINIGLGMIEGILGISRRGDISLLGTVFSLAVLLPAIAVGVRRMHDTGRSGWYLLIPIYNWIIACFDGVPGENQYGPDPKMEI